MNLLLLLTALFASLTGAGAGDGAVRQAQGVAVVQAAEVAHAAVDPARRAIPALAAPAAARVERSILPASAAQPLVATYLPFERRLE
ncbi:MAG: hypothetical protein J7500_12025 [Sphingomonas sp.]|uniref:hypothetical protein n=1 Tax=Sphingomonas sp. TaxID=28214 RepID=UPI001B0DA9AB|nr:hypothetical protein [Sphingomonas sp.]MBO9623428.1 hypothetical protein [Sphingomonas sp.]